MKVTETTQIIKEGVQTIRDEKKVTLSSGETFDARLKKVATDNYETRIAALLEQIEEQAGKLTKKVDIRELKAYKRLVSDFLEEAVNNSHKFSREDKLDRRGRHRVYASIKKVNESLEKLTQEVLKGENDNLKVLQQLGEIRGLLLDILT